MKFSIIIPTYNVGKKLIKTVDSIIAQNYKDYEIIVQDGCSTDNTQCIIQDYEIRFSFFRYYIEKDTGVYDAMNRATQKAKGLFCVYLGAGDCLHDEKVLEDLNKAISEQDKVDIFYGYVIETDKGKCSTLKRKINWKYKVRFAPVCHQAICAKRELLNEYPFDTQYKIAADQDWLLKMLKMNKTYLFINRAIAYYPLDGVSSNSNDLFIKEQKQIHKTYYPMWQFIRQTWRVIVGKENNNRKRKD